jgi:ABC-type nitrate/sulfonate/bicarbonate transport system substrate-binding protein
MSMPRQTPEEAPLTRTVCRFVLLAIAIVAVSALTVVGGAAAATSGGSAAKSGVREANITITFGETALQAGYWPLYIAQTKGFFAAQKLNVTTLVTQNSANDTAAVLSGSLLVSSGTPDGFLLALAKGQQVRAVFALRNAPAYSLIVGKNINSWADLKGQRIGVSAVTSSDAFFIQKMLAAHGLQSNDYQLLSVGGTPARVAALQSGGISGSLIDQPQDFAIEAQGFKSLGVSSDVVKDYAWAWGVVTQAYASKHRAAVGRLIKGLQNAVTWFYNPAHRTQAIAILANAASVSTQAAAATYDLWVQKKVLVPNLKPSASGLLALEGLMLSSGEAKGVTLPTPSQFIDLSYLNAAHLTAPAPKKTAPKKKK